MSDGSQANRMKKEDVNSSTPGAKRTASGKQEGLPPIMTAPLFSKLDGLLLELLRSLSDDEWERQTISPRWKVKDVAAHLLDTALRRLSLARDQYRGEVKE